MYLNKTVLTKKAAFRALGKLAKRGLIAGGLGLGGYGLLKATSNWDSDDSYGNNARTLWNKLKKFNLESGLQDADQAAEYAKRMWSNVPAALQALTAQEQLPSQAAIAAAQHSAL